jgi:hypothetical protein
MEKRNAENWDGLKLEDLAKAYFECREMMWKIIADKVGEKWQHVESKVHLKFHPFVNCCDATMTTGLHSFSIGNVD